MEGISKITGKAPLLQLSDVQMFYNLRQDFDISKSKLDLGFKPSAPQQAVVKSMMYLKELN